MGDRAEVLEVRTIHDGRVVKLGIERVRLPNGKTTELEIIRHQGAAAVVPLLDDGTVLLVRQYRHAVGDWILEVPAGKLDSGEAPETCARRETEEEVGMRVGRLDPLGPIWTTPGFTDEKIWLFLATQLEPGHQALEDDEALEIEKVSLEEAIALVDAGIISDSKSVVALLKAERLVGGSRGHKT
jgi:ADP-ribose pyrophosphatase